MSSNYVIETRDLSKNYGRFEAVYALNLKVNQQQITGFLGRNGAGKSTTTSALGRSDPPMLS